MAETEVIQEQQFLVTEGNRIFEYDVITEDVFTVEFIKRHLNIDLDYTDDDEYIMSLAMVGKEIVEKHTNRKFTDYITIPRPLIHVIMLLVGNFYANREEVIYASTSKLPHSVDYILNMYTNYKTLEE